VSAAASDAGGAAVAPEPGINPWLIAVIVTLATFMEVLDTSIANVALPHIAGSLSAGQDESTWVLTSYLVSNAIILPMSGWFSNLIGRKRFYMACVVLFTLSSFLCGLAPSLNTLIFFRVLQGLGGGGLQPSEQAILADTFAPAKRGLAFAMYGMAVVLAPAIGPTLGGWITDNYSWRWVFYVNVPVGVLSVLLTSRFVHDPPHLKRRERSTLRVDYIGLSLLALGLGALQVVLDKGQRDDWFSSHFILTLTIIAFAGIVGAIFWEWFHTDPIIDLKLFRDRSFAVSTSMMFCVGFALLGTTLLLPLFSQTLLGYTAEKAGLSLMPGGFLIMLLMPLVGFMLTRYQPRYLLIFGWAWTSFALLRMTNFDLNMAFRDIAIARMVQAGGLAFLFVPINTAAYAFLPREKNNQASGLINLARNIGGSVGISFVTTMLDRRSQFHQSRLIEHLNPGSMTMQSAMHGMSQAFVERGSSASMAAQRAHKMLELMVDRQAQMLAYIDNFKILAIAAACMVPLAFFLKKPKHHAGGEIPVH
jgi:MFS transporter, DHA2 family, multidrug resistance protein